MPKKSNPAASAVMFMSCRRITHLHLSEADSRIEFDAGSAFSTLQVGVAVDPHATVAFVVPEESHLARTGVAADVDLDTAWHQHDEMAGTDGCFDGGRGSSGERHGPQIERQLARRESVLTPHIAGRGRGLGALPEAPLERHVDQ